MIIPTLLTDPSICIFIQHIECFHQLISRIMFNTCSYSLSFPLLPCSCSCSCPCSISLLILTCPPPRSVFWPSLVRTPADWWWSPWNVTMSASVKLHQQLPIKLRKLHMGENIKMEICTFRVTFRHFLRWPGVKMNHQRAPPKSSSWQAYYGESRNCLSLISIWLK